MSASDRVIDYKTHILIGVRTNGIMAVIGTWPYVPPQAAVQKMMDDTPEPYVMFALCTPTSILPVDRNAPRGTKRVPSRFGSAASGRRRS